MTCLFLVAPTTLRGTKADAHAVEGILIRYYSKHGNRLLNRTLVPLECR